MWYKKHSLQCIDIWYGHFQSPPLPLPSWFKVTVVYRKGPRVLKQGQSKFFSQAMTHTHTKSQTQNKNSRKFEAEYMSCNLLSL